MQLATWNGTGNGTSASPFVLTKSIGFDLTLPFDIKITANFVGLKQEKNYFKFSDSATMYLLAVLIKDGNNELFYKTKNSIEYTMLLSEKVDYIDGTFIINQSNGIEYILKQQIFSISTFGLNDIEELINNNVDPKLLLKIDKTSIINDLTSENSEEVLAAPQGKVLNEKIEDHMSDTENPHNVNKEQLGLSEVENKSSETIRSEITVDNIPELPQNKITNLEEDLESKLNKNVEETVDPQVYVKNEDGSQSMSDVSETAKPLAIAKYNSLGELIVAVSDSLGAAVNNDRLEQFIASIKGIANGLATLDNSSKVPISQLPNTVIKYIGAWNATTNTPTLISPDLSKAGNAYIVSATGNRFGIDWKIDDWLIYNDEGIPEWAPNGDSVKSVAGKQGVVVLEISDIVGLVDALDGKVDKVAGKGLSTEDYTTAEKSKLSGIQTGAQVNPSASAIKTAYESNADTNAFTDGEKSKLSGIETGAQVNTVTSVAGKTGVVVLNATDVGALPSNTELFSGDYQDLTNKPTIDQLLGSLSTLGFVKRSGTNTYIIDTSTYQPLDADLTSIAGLSGTSGLLKKTVSNTWSLDTSVYLTSITKLMVEAVLTGTIITHTHNASDIVEDATHRFVTDTEKSTWNSKQSALGFTPENQANKKTTLTDNDVDFPTTKAVKTAIDTAISQTLKPMGNWDASTNTPTLTNGNISKANQVYYVNGAGTQFGITFGVGDELVYNTSGVIFKRDNVDAVISVNGKEGVVTLTQDDVADGSTYKRVTDTEKSTWNDKVDKVAGKGLSTEDYTSDEKSKLSGIETGAQVNKQPDEDTIILNANDELEATNVAIWRYE